jgi:hypothetical protein
VSNLPPFARSDLHCGLTAAWYNLHFLHSAKTGTL